MTSSAPRRRPRASAKSKKNWRKTTQLAEDVDAHLEDQRQDERLGGSFHAKKDEELFVVDSVPQPEEDKVGSNILTSF